MTTNLRTVITEHNNTSISRLEAMIIDGAYHKVFFTAKLEIENRYHIISDEDIRRARSTIKNLKMPIFDGYVEEIRDRLAAIKRKRMAHLV